MDAAKRNRSVYVLFTPGDCTGYYTSSGSYEIVIDTGKDDVDTGDRRFTLAGKKENTSSRRDQPYVKQICWSLPIQNSSALMAGGRRQLGRNFEKNEK